MKWILFNFRTPFDRETYFGFIACLMLQSIGCFAWTFAYMAPLILYMGLCSYIVAHAMDFKTIVIRLDDQVILNHYTVKKKKKHPININLILIRILTEAIESHLDLFKYDTDLNLFYLRYLNEFSLLSTDYWRILASPFPAIYIFNFYSP